MTSGALLLAALSASPASASFGFEDFDVAFTNSDGTPAIQAGSHPFAMTTKLDVNTKVDAKLGVIPDGAVKDLIVDLPPGLAFDPHAVPRCSEADFLLANGEHPFGNCPDATAVGFIKVRGEAGNPIPSEPGVVFNLIPTPGVAAKFGFHVLGVTVVLEGGVRSDGERNLFASLSNISQAEPFYGSLLTLWGNPANPAHDEDRGECLIEAGGCPVNITERPFITLPRSCSGPLITAFEADSWQNPGIWVKGQAETHDDLEPPNPLGLSDCAKLGFGPQISAQPTNQDAESPSGLDFNLDVNDQGLRSPTGIAQSDIEKAVLTLPEGVTANPSLAEGLGVCSPADYGKEAIGSEPGEGCPQSSKIGSLEAETPLLEGETLKGALFVAQPDDPATAEHGAENPFDSLIALYMVIKDPQRGILVKQAGEVEPDLRTGRLITTFDDLPQFPLGHVHVHLREGGRSPLITPPHCGTFTTRADFTPWANPAQTLATTASFQITAGVGGSACPRDGVPAFNPGFEAGTINNAAKSYSPVYMRLTRSDGEQDMTKLSTTLTQGLVGKLAGIARCPDSQIAAAKAKSAKRELVQPSCPANSKIGRLLAGAGVGSELTYVPGSLYLAGPHHGDPLSVVAIVPAEAGPFDAGTVVVREALTLNPTSAEVEVDGAASDPIPHILKGIVLKVRDIRIYADRPDFTFNPTSCRASEFRATVFGGYLDVFSAADDIPISRTDRFQAADCASLGFKPKLSIAFKGGIKRGGHPALRAVVTPRPKDANFARAVVTLPRSAFLDQGHIRTICTRVQFAAHACPAASVYGFATVRTPVLDEPAKGPVYLRSSNHNLPDLVMALKGPPSAAAEVDLVGRIDSHKGGIRASFESIPDFPVSKFVLEMQGGEKGLIVNSRNLCARPSRAIARLGGQNGRWRDFKPLVRPSGCGKQSHKQRRSARLRRR
jgi:hypothetical protein